MRLVQQVGGGVRKHRDARSAQCTLVGRKALAPAQQNAEVIVPAGPRAVLAAHGEALPDHLGNAAGNDGGVAVHVCAVDDVDLAHALIGRVLIAAHHKPLAVAVIDAAQPPGEEGLKQIVDARNDAGRTAEVRVQRQRGRQRRGLRVGLPALLLVHKDAGVGQSEAVDALLDVADKEQIVGLGPCQRKINRVLQCICVLVLVHQHGGVPCADRGAERCALVGLGQQQVQRQVLIIRVVQHLFGALGRKAAVGKCLGRPHQRGHQRRSAAAVCGELLRRAEQHVLLQARHLVLGTVPQLGRGGRTLVGILAALDAARAPPAGQDGVQRGQALVPVAFL